MRRLTRLSLGIALAIGIGTACGAFGGDDPAATAADGGSHVSSDAPAAEEAAAVDAADRDGGFDGGSTFCARNSGARFCADFEDPLLDEGWTGRGPSGTDGGLLARQGLIDKELVVTLPSRGGTVSDFLYRDVTNLTLPITIGVTLSAPNFPATEYIEFLVIEQSNVHLYFRINFGEVEMKLETLSPPFSKIVSLGTVPTAPTRFTMTATKNGLTYQRNNETARSIAVDGGVPAPSFFQLFAGVYFVGDPDGGQLRLDNVLVE